MANAVKLDAFKKNNYFVAHMLKSNFAKRLVMARGQLVQKKANSMYGAHSYGLRTKTTNRVRAYVYTGDTHAMRSNLLHNTLKKSLGGK